MIGAITGDIVGSIYEFAPIKTAEFPLFDERCRITDDTVLTVAVADAILRERDYGEAIHEFANRHPSHGYGGMFRDWMRSSKPRPYDSFGNGAAMRVCPVGYAFDTADETLIQAQRSAEVTHNHPEGIKGAQATALAVYLARRGAPKEEIRSQIASWFDYDLNRTVDEIRPNYCFDVTCQGTVPEAIVAFLDAGSFEEAIRNAVSLGGDADTLACITGGIAEAFWGGVPELIESEALRRLPDDLACIVDEFRARFCSN